jgi:hypothetical protein
MKYQYVQGLDPQRAADAEEKMDQETLMLLDRLRAHGGDSLVRDFQAIPNEGMNEDDPRMHMRRMDEGRQMLKRRPSVDVPPGLFDSVVQSASPLPSQASVMRDVRGEPPPRAMPPTNESVRAQSGAAISPAEAERMYAPTPGGDGIDHIGQFAQQLLARAQQRGRR